MSPLEQVCVGGDENCRSCENGGVNKWRSLFLRMQRKGVLPSYSSGPSNPDSKNHLFGRPLFSVCDEDKSLPKPIRDLLTELWWRGPAMEGVFRKAGNAKLVAAVKAQLNAGEDLDTESQPVVLLAALLKDFLRQLPGGLLGAPLYSAWMSAMEREDPRGRCAELKVVSDRLQKANVRLLQQLLHVLHRISQSADSNKMDARNLAVCISPNLLPLPHLSLDKVEKVTVLTQFLIENCGEIFSDSLQTFTRDHREDQLANSTDSLWSHGQDLAHENADPAGGGPLSPVNAEERVATPSRPSSVVSRRPVNRRRSEPALLRSAGMRTLLKLTRGHAQEGRLLRKQNSHDSFLLPHHSQTIAPPLPSGSSVAQLSSADTSPSPGSSPGPSHCPSFSKVCLESSTCSLSDSSLVLSSSALSTHGSSFLTPGGVVKKHFQCMSRDNRRTASFHRSSQ